MFSPSLKSVTVAYGSFGLLKRPVPWISDQVQTCGAIGGAAPMVALNGGA